MTLYLDADIVVATLIDEPATLAVADWFDRADDDMALTDLAVGEVVAALHRAIRDERIGDEHLAERLRLFDGWREQSCVPVSHLSIDIRLAIDYVRRFELALRMPDAIHLATCARLGLTLATRDRRILRAARALGIPAVRPGDVAETLMQP